MGWGLRKLERGGPLARRQGGSRSYKGPAEAAGIEARGPPFPPLWAGGGGESHPWELSAPGEGNTLQLMRVSGC